jgi:hypothetical protein
MYHIISNQCIISRYYLKRKCVGSVVWWRHRIHRLFAPKTPRRSLMACLVLSAGGWPQHRTVSMKSQDGNRYLFSVAISRRSRGRREDQSSKATLSRVRRRAGRRRGQQRQDGAVRRRDAGQPGLPVYRQHHQNLD